MEHLYSLFHKLNPFLRRLRDSTQTILFREIKLKHPSYVFVGGFVVSFFFVYTALLISAPRGFETNVHITVPEGSSLRQVAILFEEQSVIRSPLVFQIAVHFYDGEEGVQAGVYTFPARFSVFRVAQAVIRGDYQVPPFRMVVFEGMRVEQIAEILAHENDIDYEEFVTLAKPYEGHLFPATYFIPEAYTAEDIVVLMRQTFDERVAGLQEEIDSSPFTLEEIVILASILEREARSEESMRTVAGILLKRLDIGMPLQVDATFEYFLPKSSSLLTLSDLATESPYNTYLNKGLPPTPIANPGLKAIKAILDPIETDYLFYLTAPGGVFHYSKTFEEHKRNKDLYL